MPVISKIGARTWRVRLLYAAIFGVLTLGAVTMIYPFLLMLSGSLHSDADATSISPYPRFWFEDQGVYQKYMESKYNENVEWAQVAWNKPIGAWIKLPAPDAPPDAETTSKPAGFAPSVEEYRQWLGSECQQAWWYLGHTSAGKLYPINARLWRNVLYTRFDGDIDRFRRAYDLPLNNWNIVKPPPRSEVRFAANDPYRVDFAEFARSRPIEDRIVLHPDGMFWQRLLSPTYGRIEGYNRTHGTTHESYEEVFLDTRVPPGGTACEDDWREFVRSMRPAATASAPATLAAGLRSAATAGSETRPQMSEEFVRLGDLKPAASHLAAFAAFLPDCYRRRALVLALDEYNRKKETTFTSFDQIGLAEYNRAMAKSYKDIEELALAKFCEGYKLKADSASRPATRLADGIADLAARLTLDDVRDRWEQARTDWEEFVLAQFRGFLARKYTDAAAMNQAYGLPPGAYSLEKAPVLAIVRADWQDYVRGGLTANFIRFDAALTPRYRAFLPARYEGDLAKLNEVHKKHYASFDVVPLRLQVPDAASDEFAQFRLEQSDWDGFLKDRDACPAEMISIWGPRQSFEQFLAKQHGKSPAEIGDVRMPIAAMDAADALRNKSELRWEFTLRNYKHVLEYILLHGRGIVNTLIFVVLAITTNLVVNPLAAYALSRYKPRSTYKILLFCMATMAFPGEVTMIPGFLLLRRFPLWPLGTALVTLFVALWVLNRIAGKEDDATARARGGAEKHGASGRRPLQFSIHNESFRVVLAIAIAVGAGILVSTFMAKPHVSLLNTFAALVLPGMANGFSIFLLKGFFDSLPRELYEAAELDGAGEWTKFWSLTMNLSKPILAVIALGTFTGAYSAFMMALIIIPDQSMWTLMVWIFQLQSQAHPGVVYASLVIAAIPTLLIFTLCQNIIIRGIVVPTEK